MTEPSPQPSDWALMMQMITNYWLSQAIYGAAKLGIADLIKDGPKSIEVLATETETNTRALYRVLRALASVGIFSEVEPKVFGMTPLGRCLQTDVPESLRYLSILFSEEHFRAWAEILHSLKTERPGFEKVYGMPAFEYFDKHPETATTFNSAMTNFSNTMHNAVADAYDFSGMKIVADIGGGQGALLRKIMSKNEQLQTILFDLPKVVAGAPPLMEAAGVSERCKIVGGDFFQDDVPSGCDAYILSTVIHDWDDAESIAILKNCHKAMPASGKLLLVELVIPEGDTPSFSKLLDLNMMMLPGGRERTEAEYQALYNAAGFELTRVVPTKSPACVVEGVKI